MSAFADEDPGGSLMGRRTILLVAACLVAALGAGLVFLYTNTAGDASASESIEVYVATAEIQPGTSGSSLGAANVQQKALPASAIPNGALTNLADVADKNTLVTILPGQPLLAAQFANGNATGGLPIPAGKLAISVELGDPQRVAGFVQPGSYVTVFSTNNGATTALLPSAYVVAVGPAVVAPGGAASDKSDPIVTFALTQADATRLVTATSSGGSLYLGLLGAH